MEVLIHGKTLIKVLIKLYCYSKLNFELLPIENTVNSSKNV